MERAELDFISYMNGDSSCGTFIKNLYDTIMCSDTSNFKKLSLGFPDETKVVDRYRNEEGYWVNLLNKNKIL